MGYDKPSDKPIDTNDTDDADDADDVADAVDVEPEKQVVDNKTLKPVKQAKPVKQTKRVNNPVPGKQNNKTLKPLKSYSLDELKTLAKESDIPITYKGDDGSRKTYKKDELYNKLLNTGSK